MPVPLVVLAWPPTEACGSDCAQLQAQGIGADAAHVQVRRAGQRGVQHQGIRVAVHQLHGQAGAQARAGVSAHGDRVVCERRVGLLNLGCMGIVGQVGAVGAAGFSVPGRAQFKVGTGDGGTDSVQHGELFIALEGLANHPLQAHQSTDPGQVSHLGGVLVGQPGPLPVKGVELPPGVHVAGRVSVQQRSPRALHDFGRGLLPALPVVVPDRAWRLGDVGASQGGVGLAAKRHGCGLGNATEERQSNLKQHRTGRGSRHGTLSILQGITVPTGSCYLASMRTRARWQQADWLHAQRRVRFLAGLLLLVPCAVRASPWEEPTSRLVERLCRLDQLECVLGASDTSRLREAERLALRPDDAPADPRIGPLSQDLSAELAVARDGPDWKHPRWRLRPSGLLSGGDLVPDYRQGDTEPGWFSARLGGEAQLYPGIFELSFAGDSRLDLPTSSLAAGDHPLGLGVHEAWAGLASHGVVMGFGLRDRHLGPGRNGSLMLTDNATPSPMGSVALTTAAGQRLGRFHAEGGVGWLAGKRNDVQAPGWLLLDLRWLPLPLVEVGASRVAIFGGKGRPFPNVGQLLLPTEPHVYNDPGQLKPDQDEIAALDARLTLPVGRWAGISSSRSRVDGLDTIELWTQYGGEDVIAGKIAGVSFPSLAGVANLFGGEVAAGPLVLTGEYSRLLDDYFRWYTGHRVYHDGFTRDGRSMGEASGGDAIDLWGAVSWEAGSWGLELDGERRLRVGVIESLGPNLLALSADEVHHRIGIRGWTWTRTGWWSASLQLERIRGQDFVAGADGWAWRVMVGR